MSIKVMSLVWDAFPGAGGSELLVLLALADRANDEGLCWPGITEIAAKTRISRSQARRVVHRLIDDGYVRVVGNANGGWHKEDTRRYLIILDAMTGSASARGSADATGGASAAEGSHGCAETGSAHATQTIIEPPTTVKKNSRVRKGAFDALARLVELGVQQQVAEDWLTLRKTKKAATTETAIRIVVSEASKAGVTVEGALTTCCLRGWQGFEAEWLIKSTPTRAAPQQSFATKDYGQGGDL
jgi:hypothetical protein